MNDINIYPLYHGTDLRIVKMSKDERESFRDSCIKANEYLWKIFKPYYDEDRMDDLQYGMSSLQWNNLCDTLTRCHAHENQNEQYQYDSFHLTTFRIKAERYALRSFAFGEIGLTAYRMYDAVRTLKLSAFNPHEVLMRDLEKISVFAEDVQNIRPVLFEIRDLDLNLIQVERKGSLERAVKTFGNDLSQIDLVFHYNGEVYLDSSEAIIL